MKDQETCRLSNRIMIVAPSSRLTELEQLLSTHPELSERMVLIPGLNTLTEALPPLPANPPLSSQVIPVAKPAERSLKVKNPKQRQLTKTSLEPTIPR